MLKAIFSFFVILSPFAHAGDGLILREWRDRNIHAVRDWYRKKDAEVVARQSALAAFYDKESGLIPKVGAVVAPDKLDLFLNREYYARLDGIAREGRLISDEYNRRMAAIQSTIQSLLDDRSHPAVANRLTVADSGERYHRGKFENDLENIQAKEQSRQRGSYVTFEALLDPEPGKLPELTAWKNKKVFFRYYLNDREITPYDQEFARMQTAMGRLMSGIPDDNLTFETTSDKSDQGLRFRDQKFKVQFLGVNYLQQAAPPGGYPPPPQPSYYPLEDSSELDKRLTTLARSTLRRVRLLKQLEAK